MLVVFGAGKIPSVLGDLGKGMREMRKSLTEAEETKQTLETDLNRPVPLRAVERDHA